MLDESGFFEKSICSTKLSKEYLKNVDFVGREQPIHWKLKGTQKVNTNKQLDSMTASNSKDIASTFSSRIDYSDFPIDRDFPTYAQHVHGVESYQEAFRSCINLYTALNAALLFCTESVTTGAPKQDKSDSACCEFYSNNGYLKCAVNPSGNCAGCNDFVPLEKKEK